MSTEQAPEPRKRTSGKLEHPGIRRRLIQELARGEKTQNQLAREYNVVASSITEFKQRHVDEINQIAQNLDDEFAGQWIARKADRLEALMALYDDPRAEADIKVQIDILRKAAEELGQIPNRTTITMNQPVEVRLVGIDTEQL